MWPMSGTWSIDYLTYVNEADDKEVTAAKLADMGVQFGSVREKEKLSVTKC